MLTSSVVKAKGKEIGFDLVGITHAGPNEELALLLEKREKEGLRSEFEVGTPRERTNPGLFLPQARSVIMVALNYFNTLEGRRTPLAKLSLSAYGKDYHQVMQEKLADLGQTLKKTDRNFRYRAFADMGPLVERDLAYQAGLGWIGKNATLITREFGSWVFLGGMVTNAELEADRPLKKDCGNCVRCLQACPGGALEAPYQLNPNKCSSYLTQKKGYLTHEERLTLGDRLYGCDTCQEVCPFNQQSQKPTNHAEFQPLGHENLPLETLLKMSNKEFQSIFGPTGAGWRGKNTLIRNGIIALGNKGNGRTKQTLIDGLASTSPVVRGFSAWALGKIKDREGETILKEAWAKEQDEQVIQEIESALARIEREN